MKFATKHLSWENRPSALNPDSRLHSSRLQPQQITPGLSFHPVTSGLVKMWRPRRLESDHTPDSWTASDLNLVTLLYLFMLNIRYRSLCYLLPLQILSLFLIIIPPPPPPRLSSPSPYSIFLRFIFMILSADMWKIYLIPIQFPFSDPGRETDARHCGELPTRLRSLRMSRFFDCERFLRFPSYVKAERPSPRGKGSLSQIHKWVV